MNKKISSNTGEFGIYRSVKNSYTVTINGKRCGVRKTLEEAITLRNKCLKGTKQAELNYYLSREGGTN
jgi:hypothetical protein